MKLTSRRDFIKKSALTAGSIPLVSFPLSAFSEFGSEESLSINVFSKQLQFLDYQTTGQIAAELGFSGVDLTVRPNGHVLPEMVKTDLPKAVSEIEKGGSICKMITTSIESVDSPLDVDILKASSKSGIEFYRTNWFPYIDGKLMTETLEIYKEQIRKLGLLNEELGLIGCYQNHAGIKVGSSFWEVKKILETVNPAYFGAQYDVRHGMVEGGYSWENGFKLLHSQIKVIVLKDFKWAKLNGKWEAINVPIGEGMVDFDKYFKLLKKYKLNPPVSLHLEYDLGGAEKGNRDITVDEKVVFRAMERDMNRVQNIWREA